MVLNDFPYPKTWGLKKNQISSLHRSWVTSRSSPWPPTAHTGGSCPSGPSEVSGNGPKWFPILKNLGFKKNQISSLHRSWVTSRSPPWPPTARTGGSCPSGPSEASGNGPKWFPIPKNLGFKKIRSLACIEAELLPEVLLDLLQPVQAVLALQVHLRPLAMVPNDSPYPKTWGLKKIKFLAYPEAKLLREDVLDLLQPVQAVLALQVNLGPLEMVPNDLPYPKT